MRKVSVIVPVYNVHDYLERCLYSLAYQTLDDIEIIVINDGSTDDSQKIIDNFESDFPDRIVSLSIPNGGVANARNEGLKIATGEYIGFVDSDDYVDAEMFEKMYNKAKEENSDIVTAGYTRMYGMSSKDFQLGDIHVYGKSLTEEPSLLVTGVPYIWNKIFRHDLIDRNNIRFEKFAIFEDLLFTYSSFAYANKISKCDLPLYYYRVRRDGAATQKFTRKFFDIFGVTDLLIKQYQKAGIFDQMNDYICSVFLHHATLRLEDVTKSSEVKTKLEFVDRMWEYLDEKFPKYKENKVYHQYFGNRPARFLEKRYWKKAVRLSPYLPSKKRLAQSDAVRHAYTVLKNTAGNIKRSDTLKRILKPSKQKGSIYLQYIRTLDINPKAILLDSQHGDDINGNMFYLARYILHSEEYKDFTVYIPARESRLNEFKTKLDFYNLNVNLITYESNEYLKVLATAKYLFNDTSFMTYFIKREGQVFLNTWHGTPFKTLGRSSKDEMHRIGNLQKNFRIADYILFPNDFMKNHMVEDYILDNISENKIMMCGYPRNVVFFEDKNQEIIKSENLSGKQILAYLPTWRGNLGNTSGASAMAAHLDELDRKLNEDQICFVNLHPYMKGKISFSGYTHLKQMPQKYETYDFLNCCDILITDYSSVFFDFACSKKKIILFAYDEEEYLRDRGLYFPFSDLPFTKVKTVAELIDAINNSVTYDDDSFLQKFCYLDSVDSAKKVCDLVVLNRHENTITENVPDNGKKNIVFFVSHIANDIDTDNLFNLLHSKANSDVNCYICFKSGEILENKNVLRSMPKEVKYISLLGKPSISPKEQSLLNRAAINKSAYAGHSDRLDTIFTDELTRVFQHTRIDELVVWNSNDALQITCLSKLNCKKTLYIPKIKKACKRLNPIIYSRYEVIASSEKIRNQLQKLGATNVQTKPSTKGLV